MKLLISLLIFIFGLFFPTYAQSKLACVDTNILLRDSKRVKEAQDQLRAKIQEYQAKIDEKRKQLDELKRQIESKAISDKAKEEKIKEYQRIEAEGFELQQKAQREITMLKEELEIRVLNDVRSVVEQVAKSKGYNGVMDCAVFLYHSGEIADITQEVLQALDTSQ